MTGPEPRVTSENDYIVEWGHRYPDGSVIEDSSEVVAKSRAAISAVSAARDGREPLILMCRLVTPWEEAPDA